ncbi:HDIG domain-containing protein [bacterium 3DAC]|nr:HDIG domain-containing protein [bacterium 3DAC]
MAKSKKRKSRLLHLIIGSIILFATIAGSIFITYVPVSVGKPAPSDIYARKTAIVVDQDAIKLMKAEIYNALLPPRYRLVSVINLFSTRIDVLTTLMNYDDFSPGDVVRYKDVFGADRADKLVKLLLSVSPDDYPILSGLIYKVGNRLIYNGITSPDDIDKDIERALSDEGVFSEYREVVKGILKLLIPGVTDDVDEAYVESKLVSQSLTLSTPVKFVSKGDLILKKGQIVAPADIHILNMVGYTTTGFYSKLAEGLVLTALIALGIYGLYLWRRQRYGRTVFMLPYIMAVWYGLFFVLMWYFPYERVGFWVAWTLGLVLMYAVLGTRITIATSIAVLAILIWRFSVPTILIASALILLFGSIYPFRLMRMGKYMLSTMIGLMAYSAVSTGIASYVVVSNMKAALLEAIWTAVMVPGSVIVVFFLIPFLERRWRIITPLNLIRLMQPTHPLLKRLSMEAPGTYQHSYAVAILCQKAAEAIGADSLLAYVGALYHDVGKLYHPEYFIENLKPGMPNPHDESPPYVSAQRIKAHVKEGVKLIRKYKLPTILEDFVTTHHGTMLIKYFYKKAKALGEEVYEKDFRYDGPLPSSKETTILMLADSIEAAVRSMPDHSREAICAKVEEIFKERLEDGQLDRSRLSFEEMNKIKEVFCDVLRDMYHGRIRYDNVEEIYGKKNKQKKESKEPKDKQESGEGTDSGSNDDKRPSVNKD